MRDIRFPGVIEGGDYFGFVRQGEKEMRAYFYEVNRVDVAPQTALYLCSRPRPKEFK